MGMVFIGTPLPLNIVIEDGATDKFPLAHVFDQNDVEIAGSPFNLTHVAFGYYRDNTYVTVNNDKRLTAIYKIYEDAGHTELGIYLQAEDVFDIVPVIPTNPLLTTDPRLDFLDIAISTRATPADVQNIINGLGLDLTVANIEGILSADVNDNDHVFGEVEIAASDIYGEVTPDSITGSVQDENDSIYGEVELSDSDITGVEGNI